MDTFVCTRGRFLAATGAVSAASLCLSPLRVLGAGSNERVLVLVAQTGGCDMLNTVFSVPQYGRYHDLRNSKTAPYDKILNLCLPEEQLGAVVLDDELALHPKMAPFKSLFDEGHLAVVNGLGLPASETNRLSHEAARFDWQTATINGLGAKTPRGWIARAVGPQSFPPLVSTLSPTPIIFQGGDEDSFSVGPSLEDFAGLSSVPNAYVAGAPNQTAAERSAVSAEQRAQDLSAQVKRIAEDNKAEDYPSVDTDLDAQMKTIARLIASENGCRAYFAAQDGYDTHAEQNRAHPDLLATFTGALTRFYMYLRARGLSRNVVVASVTDFGRRAVPDANFGTDHGTAQAAFVLGDDVRGGVYGEYPKLSALDGDGNVDVSVDFRDHLGTLADYLGFDPAATGLSGRNLGFLPRA